MQAIAESLGSELIQRLDAWREARQWRCGLCRERRSGHKPRSGFCPACEPRAEERRLQALSKAQALACPPGSRVPGVGRLVDGDLRADWSWIAEPWPRDPRAKEIDPIAWASAAAGRPFLTMAQVNGSGKSTRAAHLLWLSFRSGLRPVLWVTEPELQEEASSYAARGGVRPLYHRAREAGALVIDEVGSMRGAWADTEGALGVMLALVSYRLSAGRRTIFTTHRPLSREKARQAGKEGHSLQEIAPALYDRLKEGLIIPLPAVSYRGQWTATAATAAGGDK